MTQATKRHNWRVLFVLLAMALAIALLPGSTGAGQATDDEVDNPDDVSVVTLSIPSAAVLETIVDRGYDLDHNLNPSADGYTVTGIIRNDEVAGLEALGVGIDVEADSGQMEAVHAALMAERQATLDAKAAIAAELNIELEDVDTVVIARADYFTSIGDSEYVSVEAKSTDLQDADLTVEWDAGPGTEIGDGGSASLSPFVDAGEYQYHRGQFELGGQSTLTIDSGSAAGSYEAVGSSFGPPLDTTGVSGTIELVNDGSGDPTEGCDPLVGFTAGNVALIDRGSCPFVDKVENAEAAGAIGAIVANNNPGSPFAMSGGSSTAISSAMISQADGATIKAGLPTTGTLALLPPLPPPTKVRVTSSNGGSAEAELTEWLATDFPERPHRYFQDFLDHYPDAYEYMEIIEEMHANFPELTQIIDLPYETNGYRRQAMSLSGGGTSQRVGLTSHAWGHEGGNDLTVSYVDPGAADGALSVAVTGDDIVVNLATDAAGALSSTAAEVVAAINADAAASALVVAYTYRGNDGDGIVEAETEDLTDGLNAPEHVLRAPFQVKMLRICKTCDGSKTGVLSYSQEHAREWQTPLVNIEAAYRLLYNYATDAGTRKMIDNLDIFIIPTVNPDGELYSYYDFASQRKNMTNHCDVDGSYDYNARNSWGVDNNRNYTSGSLFDGYSGASTSCTSTTFAGPSELSEPESANLAWVPETYPNITFSMNVHSSGNYFMWAPGAYIVPGRETLPRPSLGTEDYFFQASSDILTEVKQWRGLAVTPARTGPVADVLYSAAGNSGDMMYYDYGIYGWDFEVGTSFQPDWEEAHNQMMEYANGIVELMDVALDWTRDRKAPTSTLVQPGGGTYAEPVGITFEVDEPGDVYYTLDGSDPTFDSTLYQSAGVREGGETLTISETTTIKWFSVDASGNIEGKYNPARGNARTTTITITD